MTNKYFTESEWMDRYIKRPTFCPHCGNDKNLFVGSIQSDDDVPFDFAWRKVECSLCAGRWKEIYSLTAIEEDTDAFGLFDELEDA